jgi:tRNA (guanine-N7-)-methyltransferase
MREAVSEVSRLLYGRKRGRKLRPGQQALYDHMLPALRLELPAPGAGLDPAYLFSPAKRDLWLEIGFGGGEHLAWQAAAHPDTGFIGCEPFVNGLVGLFARIRERGLSNIRVFDDDARLLLAALPAASIARAFILFPDPWPKKRHHKRRIVAPATLDLLAHVLRDDAELRIASDDASYVRWMLTHVINHGAFEWLARCARDWRERPAGWPQTRYEEKAGKAGRACYFLRFKRRPRGAESGAPAP